MADVAAPPALTAQTWLDTYPADASGGDLYRDAPAPVADRWRAMAAGLFALSEGDPAALQDIASRHARELGMSFRMAGEDDERAWPLTPMPLLIGADEWQEVGRGLIQRVNVLEHLVSDIYGPQRLVAEGHLPAAVVAGSPYFARKMLGQRPPSGHYIHVYAADLARGPQGQWRVLQDRVRLATGVGYALENRLALSRTTNALPSATYARRLAEFYAQLREGIAADCRRETPRIALLTPGRYNQTYPEQAHLARYLGLPLVEGRDLSVLDDRLYIGTIAGPKRVDALWRWIKTTALDPMAFDAKSTLGVANLFDAWVAGGVEMVNWPGVEMLESPAFSAFIPRLCRVLLGEAPILPTVATWWCGQGAEARTVAARIDELALVPAFGQKVEGLPDRHAIEGAKLDPAQRSAFLEALARRPMDYCGQEIVHLSTTPAVIDGQVLPRPFTIRAFLARTADGAWTVMPGGFARLSSNYDMPTSLMGAGDLSADVWVVDSGPTEEHAPGSLAQEPQITRGGGILAAQAADNLFWFGRYNERAEVTVRIVRSILGSSIEVDNDLTGEAAARSSLLDMLWSWGALTTPGDPAVKACGKVLSDMSMPGTVPALLHRRLEVGLSLRERFARDLWQILSSPVPPIDLQRPQTMLSAVQSLTDHFGALAGLASENMIRSDAWRFLEMGKRIERALATCRIARRMIALPGTEPLSILLDLCDSQIVYRSRYLTGPMPNAVRDLVLLDPGNPRALAFQVAEMACHLEALPSVREDNLPEAPMREARALLGELQAMTAAEITVSRLDQIDGALMSLSDAISTRYFLQFERDKAKERSSLLG